MKLAEIGDVIRSYPWKCLECKSCEICREKGDDVSFAHVAVDDLSHAIRRNVSYFVTVATVVRTLLEPAVIATD